MDRAMEVFGKACRGCSYSLGICLVTASATSSALSAGWRCGSFSGLRFTGATEWFIMRLSAKGHEYGNRR